MGKTLPEMFGIYGLDAPKMTNKGIRLYEDQFGVYLRNFDSLQPRECLVTFSALCAQLIGSIKQYNSDLPAYKRERAKHTSEALRAIRGKVVDACLDKIISYDEVIKRNGHGHNANLIHLEQKLAPHLHAIFKSYDLDRDLGIAGLSNAMRSRLENILVRFPQAEVVPFSTTARPTAKRA